MNTKLTLIREKCIAANPKIATARPDAPFEREIRLADVLLAIEKAENARHPNNLHLPRIGIHSAGVFFQVQQAGTMGEQIAWPDKHWNLRADDLEQQSEETINFLADLLS